MLETIGGLIEWAGLLLPILIIALAWQFRPTRRLILFFLRLVPALLLFLVGLSALVLWTPVRWIADRLSERIPIEDMASDFLAGAAEGTHDPLTRGERLAFAQSMWSPAHYPDLYMPVPEDIRRPAYEDGRLLGGVGMLWLADRFMTETAFRSAVRGGFTAALTVLVTILLLLLAKVFFGILDLVSALRAGEQPIVEQWPGAEPVRLPLSSLIAANFDSAIANLAGNLLTVLFQCLAAIPLSAGAGIIVALLLLSSWIRAKAEPYRLVTKDAEVRWPYRSETRALVGHTFRQQLLQATSYLAGSPTYEVGTATGALRARGDLAAPTPGQSIRLDRESLFQHLLVFGGTGEGKTTSMLKPVLRQVLADPQFGAFIADAKGVLWQDALRIAKEAGRADDVVIIGTGEGQSGLDPIAGLTPTQVAATLRSVLRQVSGQAADNFWPEMAANIIRHALTIGRAYAQIPAGAAEFEATGVNPYSLWWAYRAITAADLPTRPGPMTAALASLREQQSAYAEAWKAAGKGDAADRLSRESRAIFTPEVLASFEYLEGAWAGMAAETRTGIIASVTQLLDGFSGAGVLRERFASGSVKGSCDLKQALEGKIVLNALSSIEDGLPARLVSILIKTSLYREARVREAEWRRLDPPRSPQDHPCLVVMDEVQELATVDPSSGLSDSSFWNVARSSGLAGLFATQTVAALVQAMGKEAAENFIQQARSRIFLRTEERETVDYACWCAGSYERNRVFDDAHRESLEYRALIDGWDPFAPIDGAERIAADPLAFFDAAGALINPGRLSVERAGPRPTYETDRRFIATDATPGPGGGSAGDSAAMQSLQAAHWRAEDLTRQYRMEGNQSEPALTPADLMHMGRWHAFAQVQRAGAVRQDLIRVEHDFS